MGGEPTFVSVDDMVSAEWTVAADGPQKRELANGLAGRAAPSVRPGRAGPAQPGQVVSRRAAAALADRADLAQATASRCGTIRNCWPTRSTRAGAIRRPRRAAEAVARAIDRGLRAAGGPAAALLRGPAGRARRRGTPSPTARGRSRSPRRRAWSWSPSSTSPRPSRPPGRCRWHPPGGARAGRARPGGPGGAGWCSFPATRRPACGCRSIDVLGGPGLRGRGVLRSGPGPLPSAAGARRAPSWSTRRISPRAPRWWSRPGTASCTSSCRRWRSSRSSSSWSGWSTGSSRAAAPRSSSRATRRRPIPG